MSEIVITRFSSLGDLVALEPMLRALRHFHRDDTITFVTSGLGEALYGERFDRCISYHQRPKGRWCQAGELKRALEALPAGGRFQRLYDLQASTLSLLLALRLDKEEVVHQSTRLRQKLLGRKAHGLKTPELLLAAGFPPDEIESYWAREASRQIQLPVPEAEAARFAALFAEHQRPVAVLAPGASARWVSKLWETERFAELAERLFERGFTVALIGSELEREAAAQIASRVPSALDFTAKTGVRELIGLLSEATLFIGNDSGPAHLAAGVATPTLTLFGPTSEKHCARHFAYRGEHRCIAPTAVECHPCYKPECPRELECMKSITVVRVLEEALALAAPPSSERPIA